MGGGGTWDWSGGNTLRRVVADKGSDSLGHIAPDVQGVRSVIDRSYSSNSRPKRRRLGAAMRPGTAPAAGEKAETQAARKARKARPSALATASCVSSPACTLRPRA